MISPILNAAAKQLFPIIMVVAIVLLYRGHNLPGGGFIGGLTAASAVLLYTFGRGIEASHRIFPRPDRVMVIGLGLAAISGLPALFFGNVFFSGLWLPEFYVPGLGMVHLGTPLIFDVGVFMTVIGFVVHTARALAEDDDAPASPRAETKPVESEDS